MNDELMDKYNIPEEHREAILQRCEDIAAAFGWSTERAVAWVAPAISFVEPPLRAFGIWTRRKWFERPYWLWRKRIQRRALREMEEEQRQWADDD